MENPIRAIVFDAYGTLFNINSLDTVLEDHFGDRSGALSVLWRKKQLEYTWLRTLMGRYRPFSEVTIDALINSCNSLKLTFTPEIKDQLDQEYQQLVAYPEVSSVLQGVGQKSGAWSLIQCQQQNVARSH